MIAERIARRQADPTAKDEGGTNAVFRTNTEQAQLPAGSVHTLVDHIEHIIRAADVDHVGIGSDYDGVTRLPAQLEDVSATLTSPRNCSTAGTSLTTFAKSWVATCYAPCTAPRRPPPKRRPNKINSLSETLGTGNRTRPSQSKNSLPSRERAACEGGRLPIRSKRPQAK